MPVVKLKMRCRIEELTTLGGLLIIPGIKTVTMAQKG